LRMLIPPGYMPASGRPFLLEICWEGLPADMLAHVGSPDADTMDMESMDMDPMSMGDSTSHKGPPGSHHSGSPSQSDHCVFGTACSAGPIPHSPLPSDLYSGQRLRAVAFSSIAVAVRVVHLPQARAPPSRLS
jgi:hypothetical protein